jgi:hypothetical protein
MELTIQDQEEVVCLTHAMNHESSPRDDGDMNGGDFSDSEKGIFLSVVHKS